MTRYYNKTLKADATKRWRKKNKLKKKAQLRERLSRRGSYNYLAFRRSVKNRNNEN